MYEEAEKITQYPSECKTLSVFEAIVKNVAFANRDVQQLILDMEYVLGKLWIKSESSEWLCSEERNIPKWFIEDMEYEETNLHSSLASLTQKIQVLKSKL